MNKGQFYRNKEIQQEMIRDYLNRDPREPWPEIAGRIFKRTGLGAKSSKTCLELESMGRITVENNQLVQVEL